MSEPVRELNYYVTEHARRAPAIATGDEPSVVDVHFFKVLIGEQFDRGHFNTLLDAAIADGRGVFVDMSLERWQGGPSYIEIGAWCGDQTAALMLMAAGEIAERWTVLTPAALGLDGEKAEFAAGRGLVFAEGLRDAP